MYVYRVHITRSPHCLLSFLFIYSSCFLYINSSADNLRTDRQRERESRRRAPQTHQPATETDVLSDGGRPVNKRHTNSARAPIWHAAPPSGSRRRPRPQHFTRDSGRSGPQRRWLPLWISLSLLLLTLRVNFPYTIYIYKAKREKKEPSTKGEEQVTRAPGFFLLVCSTRR